ncbi:Isoflavone-7-O-methyltransferase [Hibiscus syriacus]|uniref:Isoflavone-7-O-methyltransferase n=1 Tax=Hibiscus syriacus TaxID=106335 RepID=A0A6A3CM32_HIBSY|nr:uncharacterized hydrolase YugF-like [Hibiscus syriacus]KAE8729574.1 Isoflavone-7-O-methyltransferase [Hibiscus syriacus]
MWWLVSVCCIRRRKRRSKNPESKEDWLSLLNFTVTSFLFLVAPIVLVTVVSSLESDGSVLGLSQIKEKCSKWQWKGQYSINYFVSSSSPSSPPLLLVHGFGASIPHWRRNIGTLAQDYTVYAIDLLGFGDSDKPQVQCWKTHVLVCDDMLCLVQDSSGNMVRGIVLLNCAGRMNNKAIIDDWRIKLLFPLLLLFDFLLKQRPITEAVFERAKQRDNLRSILFSFYGNKESVDDELVEIINGPANDEGALDAFVSIITGPPGPNPVQLMPRINLPVLVLWGDQDPFTPIDCPVGKFFSSLPSKSSNVSLHMLEGVGHCPHDDKPKLVHHKLLPWLAQVTAL